VSYFRKAMLKTFNNIPCELLGGLLGEEAGGAVKKWGGVRKIK